MFTLVRLLFRFARGGMLWAAGLALISALATGLVVALTNNALEGTRTVSGWVFLIACAAAFVVHVAADYQVLKQSEALLLDIRIRLSARILDAPLRQLEEIGPSKLLTLLTEDTSALGAAAWWLPTAVTSLAAALTCLVYLFWISVIAGIYLVTILGTMATLFWRIHRRVEARMSDARTEQDSLFNALRSLVVGAKELKLNDARREGFRRVEIETRGRSFHSASLASRLWTSMAFHTSGTLFFVGLGGLLFFGTTIGVEHEVLTVYVLLAFYVRTAIENLLTAIPGFTAASIALERIEALRTELRVEAVNPPEPSSQGWSLLELRDVTHHYRKEGEDASFILGPVSMTLRPEQISFLLGGNGSGKSTLVKIIAGLYTPETGDIYLDGILITDENRAWYRSRFSAVFADYHLFDGLYGVEPSVVESLAGNYLERLALHGKVSLDGNRFSTIELSTGQRKRLALLCAFLERRSIYIFDEWASDQDPHFKRIFYLDILRELRDQRKCVLVVSHDERYFSVADQTIRLEDGKQASLEEARDP